MFYLDNAATTSVLPGVLEKAIPYLHEQFGNPSSLHQLGIEAARAVKDSRQTFARLFHVPTENVIFCGSGTESNNLALWGVAHSSQLKGAQIIVSSLEHPCVLNSAEALQNQGFQVDYIRSFSDGTVDLSHLESLISEETRLVSCMAVNNEIGTVQPLVEIGKLIKQKNPKTFFHIDAAQAFTKIALPVKSAKIDLVSISGHKIGAPKGIGALICICKTLPLSPLILGGGQEYGMRSGTENVFGIIAFAEAALLKEKKRVAVYQDLTEYRKQWLYFLEQNQQVSIFQSDHVLPYYLNLAIPPIPAEVFLHHLEAEEIYVSVGSACSSKKTQISHVFQAIGMKSDLSKSMVRLSFSEQNLSENQKELFERFSRVVQQLSVLL